MAFYFYFPEKVDFIPIANIFYFHYTREIIYNIYKGYTLYGIIVNNPRIIYYVYIDGVWRYCYTICTVCIDIYTSITSHRVSGNATPTHTLT